MTTPTLAQKIIDALGEGLDHMLSRGRIVVEKHAQTGPFVTCANKEVCSSWGITTIGGREPIRLNNIEELKNWGRLDGPAAVQPSGLRIPLKSLGLKLAEVSGECTEDYLGRALNAPLIEICNILKDEDGADLCNGDDRHTVPVVTAKQGAYWSDQPHGRNGYHVIYTVIAPDDGQDYYAIA